ncbi:hypothetical protein [Micromonospora sp. WP24]|uniref:hypothetical protein n=1 Tax=Micromonospora sp. WP24 TaxID=2604469 RepID=UPI001CA347B9|nr:hypothetical protein [Micromonospora sp. WP24]
MDVPDGRMPDRYAHSDQARPGLAPGARGPVGTLFAALHGELTPHPWRHTDRDAYSFFSDRSLAMGWLDDIGGVIRQTAGGVEETRTGAAGLWGMNDAGQQHPLAVPESSLVAWFQVGVEAVAADRPLPVQPFLRCAGDATARLGALRLDAVQVLLPVQGLDIAARPAYAGVPSLRAAGWFVDADPRSRRRVRVTLDSGQDPSAPAVAAAMRESMRRLAQDVFACESHSLTDHDPLATHPPLDDRSWLGPPLHRVTFRGTLAEWSLDSLGWLGGFLADLAAAQGVRTPLLLTAGPA